MALSKLGKATEGKKTGEKEEKSGQVLSRNVQSQEILAEAKHAHIEKSQSSATIDYSTQEPDEKQLSKARSTAVKAKAQPSAPAAPAEVAPKMEADQAAASKAIQECLGRSNTAEIEAACAAKLEKESPGKAPQVQPEKTGKAPEVGPGEDKELKKAEVPKACMPPPPEVPKACMPPPPEVPKACMPPPPTPVEAKAKKRKATEPEQPEEPAAAGTEESESEDSEEVRQKEERVRAKREAHARYMRFSRSLTSILSCHECVIEQSYLFMIMISYDISISVRYPYYDRNVKSDPCNHLKL